MLESQAEALLKRLQTRTKEGGVKWIKSDSTDLFTARIGKHYVGLQKVTMGYYLYLYDDKGVTIDSMALLITNRLFGAAERSFESAKESALGINNAIDDILRDLGE